MARKNKTVYHPLVLFFFYNGMLTKEQLSEIPKTTVNYWRKNEPSEMFGHVWVNSFSSNYTEFQNNEKHKIIYKAMRLSVKIVDSLSALFSSTKGYKKMLKNNMGLVVSTIDQLSIQLPLAKVCKLYNISMQQYYRWKNKIHCTASVFNLCYKTHPQQLTITEVATIKQALVEPSNLHKRMTTIWYSLMRVGALFCSHSTFYKYANQVDEREPFKKKTAPVKSIKATRIFEYIHIDTTFIDTLKDGKIRVVAIKDNFSKAILHCAVVKDGSSKWIALLMQELFAMYNLFDYKNSIILVSDGEKYS